MRLIDADALEREGWKLYLNYQQDENTMVYETKSIQEIPTAQPELNEWCTDCKEYDQERHCCPRWNRVIRQTLKDAQPEQKKGAWVGVGFYDEDCGHHLWYACNKCSYQTTWHMKPIFNYCPNCGAKMEEDDGK